MNSKHKSILVINLGWEQEPLLDALRQREVDIFGIHSSETYYQEPDYQDVIVADLRDIETAVAFARKVQPDAVISDQCDYSYFSQAVIAEKMDIPGPSVAQAQVATNKYIQRRKSQEAGILIPEFALCASLEDAEAFGKTHTFPIILKPVDNRGSFGVNKVDDPDAIPDAYYDALANSPSRHVLAEAFIDGQHITVDGYAFPSAGCRSLALASKLMLGNERQVAMDILYPGELSDNLYDRAFKINSDVNNSLGLTFGMLHSEYMIAPDGEIFLIETANRGGGVYTSEVIVPYVSGIDILNQYIDDALGISSDRFVGATIQRNQAILKFASFDPGKVSRIKGLKELESNRDVLRLRLGFNVGDSILPIDTDANRHGFVIMKGDGNIRSSAERTLDTLEVVYEE